jgi:hypothetical protein
VYLCSACRQKGLLNININDIDCGSQTFHGGRTMHFHFHDDKLKCPYKGCRKSFDKPTVLTDSSSVPRQTYYACPYCMSKLDVLTEDMKIVSVKPTDYPTVLDSPAKCAHFHGFLNSVPEGLPISDECLVCPKVLQCNVRRH